MSTAKDYWDRRYPERGGTESPNRRGAFGKTWWGRALIDAVVSVADPTRMARGRDYARAGQVVWMQVRKGAVVADVQGSQPRPFTSVFALRPLPDERIRTLIDQVGRTPGMLAEIVSGALSSELGPLLLPVDAAEFLFDCTCPDQGWPCKHVAALAYLTAERIDERPADILTLRGIDPDTLIGGVETAAAADDCTDLYGDAVELPALPLVQVSPAIDDLDPVPLRDALRLVTGDDRAVAAAMRELQRLYHTMTER
jgi:uncharacterized Zn finger protein